MSEPIIGEIIFGATVKTRPLEAGQQWTAERYVRVRDWVNGSMEFEQHDDRVAGWISEDV